MRVTGFSRETLGMYGQQPGATANHCPEDFPGQFGARGANITPLTPPGHT